MTLGCVVSLTSLVGLFEFDVVPILEKGEEGCGADVAVAEVNLPLADNDQRIIGGMGNTAGFHEVSDLIENTWALRYGRAV